ncbi:MAG TPA: DUF2127 domain-containing protein [Rugosimonospora sp.]|nr:DUF2127 domain-containing protein [Rugosimonospora sp.]
MDWNLRTCGRRGHITYAPDEPELRDRLHGTTPVGEVWRCLRCGDFVLGEPHGSGPAADAPLVMRGRALRDAWILRLLAVERWGRGVLIVAAAYGIYRFRAHHDAIQRGFNEDLPLIRPLAQKLHFNLDESSVVHSIQSAINARTSTLAWVAAGLAVYGVLQLVEGTGLWLLRRWGEYFAVVATSLGLPIEIYELSEKITGLRVFAFVLNVAAVLYILLSKRLFGLRGGKTAYEAQRHEASLLEVESAGGSLPGRPPARAATAFRPEA